MAWAPVARGALEVVPLATNWTPPAGQAVVAQSRFDRSGNTSVRNNAAPEWKAGGYFQRNRDLGQVFTAPRDFLLESIVLRTGPGEAAFLPGSAGARVFIQFFEVEGEPVLDDNGTPPGTDATHGFSKNHRCDDVIRGVRYRPLRVVRGGVLPNLAASAHGGRLVYMLWRLDGDDRLECRAGRRYAFLVGFEEPGEARGFTLANHNRAGDPAPPRLDDPADPYPGGWAIRREGDGTLPPAMRPGPEPPADPAPLLREALFPSGEARFAIPPSTDGYPDVDTYRDLEFYLFAAGGPRAAYERPPGPTLRELADGLGFRVGANFPNLDRHRVAPGEAGAGRFEPEAWIARDHFTIMTAGRGIWPGHSWWGAGRAPAGHDLDDAGFTGLSQTIRRHADPGLEVRITEMSVHPDSSRPIEAGRERPAEACRRVFEVCLREPGMRGIKLSGVMDPQPPRDRPALRTGSSGPRRE